LAKKYSTDHNLEGLWEEGIVVLPEYLFLVLMSFFFGTYALCEMNAGKTQKYSGSEARFNEEGVHFEIDYIGNC
jgi:hypothetical protein